MALGLKIPTKTLEDYFDLQDFKDDFNTLEEYAEQTKETLDTWEDFKANGGTICNINISEKKIESNETLHIKSSNGDIVLESQNGAMAVYSDSANKSLYVYNHNVPTTFVSEYDLGHDLHRWKDVYVGGYSKNANGYTKLPNGMIMQWGSGTCTGTEGVVVTFPISFPNREIKIIANAVDYSLGAKPCYSWVTEFSRFNAKIRTSEYAEVSYIVIGY